MNAPSTKPELPPWFTPAAPPLHQQESLFKIPLEVALAQAKVSPDELNRWHAQGWVSFAFGPTDLNDSMDAWQWELNFVRDVVRSGFSDAQISRLFDQCPTPYAFAPDLTAFSFRYGLVQAIPPIELEEPGIVIEANLDEWLEECDEERLAALLHQIVERMNALKKKQS